MMQTSPMRDFKALSQPAVSSRAQSERAGLTTARANVFAELVTVPEAQTSSLRLYGISIHRLPGYVLLHPLYARRKSARLNPGPCRHLQPIPSPSIESRRLSARSLW